MSQTPLLYDFAGIPIAAANAPITSRPGQALSTVAQGGMVCLGADANGVARVPRVDSFGTQYVAAASPAGTPAQVYTGQPTPAVTSQYGNLSMVRQDAAAPATFQPMLADPAGNLYVHHRSKPTFRSVIRAVSTAANKYLAVLVNAASASMVLRLTEVTIYVPPGGYAGGLLGASAAVYYPLICELYRVNAANVSAGTNIAATPCDTGDTLATGVTVLSAPSISSSVAALFRNDAVAMTGTGENFYQRDDPNNKSICIRPGEAVALICVSSGTVTGPGGNTINNVPVDIGLVFTQAIA